MMRRLLPFLVLLGAACDPSPKPKELPREPDWAQVERLLASEVREDRGYAVGILLVADEDRPGTMGRLAEMPEDESPALRHYTAASLLITLRNQPGALPQHRAWKPTPKTLRLLVQGLEEGRPLPVGGAADWDLAIGRFCLDALELLTGKDSPPRPINMVPSKAAVAEWRKWWGENRRFLCYDAERGIWCVDETAKRLGIPLVPQP